MVDKYTKKLIALRYTLLGRRFFKAVEAIEFAKQYHTGTRKDGFTPEFQHQVEIALYVLTLPIDDEELLHDLVTAILLHDVQEDYDVERTIIEQRFGSRVADIVWKLTKTFKGVAKSMEQYFEDILLDIAAVLAKGGDRVHNIQSMVGVFTITKQKNYVWEVEEYFLPMLKKARYRYPDYAYALLNIEHMLKSQLQLIKAIHESHGESDGD